MPQYDTNISDAKYFKYIYIATKVYVWHNKCVQSNRDHKHCKPMVNKQTKERLHSAQRCIKEDCGSCTAQSHAKYLIVEERSCWGGGFMGGCNEGAQDPPTDMLVCYLWVGQNLNRCCIGGREVEVHK